MIYKHSGPLSASSHLYFNLTETSAPWRFNKHLLKLLIGFSVSIYHALSPLVWPPDILLFHYHAHARYAENAGTHDTYRKHKMRGAQRPKEPLLLCSKKHWNQLSINVWAVSHQSFTSLHSSDCLIHYRFLISSTSLFCPVWTPSKTVAVTKCPIADIARRCDEM